MDRQWVSIMLYGIALLLNVYVLVGKKYKNAIGKWGAILLIVVMIYGIIMNLRFY